MNPFYGRSPVFQVMNPVHHHGSPCVLGVSPASGHDENNPYF